MMKKNILLLLVGLFVLVSCEEDINESVHSEIFIEQYAPVMENGSMMLSGRVSLPNEFNRETAKVGFLVTEYTKDMGEYEFANSDIFLNGYIASPYEAYRYLVSGDDDGYWNNYDDYLWVDEIEADGSFSISFAPQVKQYMCIAFALNVLDDKGNGYESEYQVLSSKPFFFRGEGMAQLELINSMFPEFKLTFTTDSDIEVGLCWSDSNPLPNKEDNYVPGYWDGYGNTEVKTESVTFEKNYDYRLNFGDSEVVYLRGYVQKRINDNGGNTTSSYKMIYSNVIEYRPKEQNFKIDSKGDMQDFIRKMYVSYSTGEYIYRGDEFWESFRGKISFNYEVQKEDWMDIYRAEYGDTVYLGINQVNCTIEGKGVIPNVSWVSNSGKIKGMSLTQCYNNYGTLENIYDSNISDNRGIITGGTHTYVGQNYGKVIDSKNVYVSTNYGLVQGCKDVYGIKINDWGYTEEWNHMVLENQSAGRILDCTIETFSPDKTYLICGSNYGYMENCLPNLSCCANNNGIIKNPYNESEYQ